jgi:hypothetical protein
VEFEPTPAQPALAYAEGVLAGTAEPPSGEVPVRQPGALDWRVAVVAVGALVVLAAVVSWVWDRRRPRPDAAAGTPRGRALRLYGRLRRALARAGLGAPPSATPDEFAAAHTPALAARPKLGASVARATALHERAAYSPHPVHEREALEAERLWGRARWAWLGLWVRRIFRRR